MSNQQTASSSLVQPENGSPAFGTTGKPEDRPPADDRDFPVKDPRSLLGGFVGSGAHAIR